MKCPPSVRDYDISAGPGIRAFVTAGKVCAAARLAARGQVYVVGEPSGGNMAARNFLQNVGFGAPTTPYNLNPFTAGLVPTGPTTTTSSIPGWQCAILMAFALPCTPAGLAAGIARGIAQLIGGGNNGGGGTSMTTCPSGTVLNPNNGICEFPGSPGDVSTPGGPSGPQVTGMGVFGAPAVAPIVVGQIGPNPIRRCPHPALVLGKDNLCYAKGSIPRQYRKWRPDPKPPITVRDVRAIRRADAARGRVKRLGKSVGLSVKG